MGRATSSRGPASLGMMQGVLVTLQTQFDLSHRGGHAGGCAATGYVGVWKYDGRAQHEHGGRKR